MVNKLLILFFIGVSHLSISQEVNWKDSSQILILKYVGNNNKKMYVAYFVRKSSIQQIALYNIYVDENIQEKSLMTIDTFFKKTVNADTMCLSCIIQGNDSLFYITNKPPKISVDKSLIGIILIGFKTLKTELEIKYNKEMYIREEFYKLDSYYWQ